MNKFEERHVKLMWYIRISEENYSKFHSLSHVDYEGCEREKWIKIASNTEKLYAKKLLLGN